MEQKNQDSNLPEVAGSNYPIVVPRDAEGMQAYRPDWDKERVGTWQADNHQKAAHINASERKQRKCSLSRKGWIILIVTVLLCIAIAVGLGAGLGIGLNSKSSGDSDGTQESTNASQTQTPIDPTSPTSVTTSAISSTATTSQAAPTCSGVTSGYRGIACVSCNQTGSENGYQAPSGSSTQSFVELCNTDMPDGSPAFDTNTDRASKTKNLTDIKAVMAYSFTECMDSCARLNEQTGTSSEPYPCQAVTYGANLTAAIYGQGSMGNCYLKDLRGAGILDSSGLVMSAYIVDS